MLKVASELQNDTMFLENVWKKVFLSLSGEVSNKNLYYLSTWNTVDLKGVTCLSSCRI